MKLKDGYKKLIGTSYNGDISQVLLSNGGNLGYAISSTASTLVQRNTNGQIESSLTDKAPFKITSAVVNTNLNADLLDGVHKEGLLTTFENINDADHPQSIKLTVGGTTKYVQTAYSTNTNLAGILGNATDANYPLLFTSAVNTSTTNRAYQNIYTDTANSLYYNPNTNTLRSPNIIATTSVTTPLVSSTGRLTLNATSTGVDLKFNNDNTKSVILNGTEFKPFDDANGNIDLGASDARWKVIYGGSGNFVGNVESIITTSDAVKHAVTNANGSVELLVHSNRGLYDRTNSKWIIYVPNGTSNVYIPTWASRGSSTQPVYFNANGEPIACTSYANYIKWTNADASQGVIGKLTLGSTTNTLYDLFITSNGTVIADSTDLNTIKTPGIRYSASSTNSATMTNAPWTSSGFRLITLTGYSSSSSYGIQLAQSSQQFFWRTMGSSNASPSSWYSWILFKYGTAVGNSTTPIYINSSGTPTACTAYSGLLTALSSSSATNLSITVGGTTKSVADMWATNIANKYHSRPTTIDPGVTGDGSMFQFKCTSSVTDTTTDPGDGHILHFNWDNNGKWDSQIYLDCGGTTLKTRGMNGSGWNSWVTYLNTSNYTSIIGSGTYWKVNSQTTVGTGDIYLEMWRGTSASWKMLNTSGTLKFQCNYTSAAGSYYDALTVAYNTGNVWAKGSITSATGHFSSSTTTYINSASGCSIIFRPGGTEKVRILKDSGYVGIGITSPTARLHVAGDSKFTDTIHVYADSTGNYTEGIRLYGTAKDSTWSNIQFGCDPAATSGTHANQWLFGRDTSNRLVFRNNTSDKIYITTAGNMGIGVAPNYKLDVNGTFNSSNYQVGGALELKTDDTACQTTVFGSNNSGYRMRIVRQATSSNLNTQYSPTLVLSSLDTHAYIAWRYDSDSVWVGGGSGNKWNWRSRLITSTNYGSYLGYIGTTAVQKSSAAQALTGITNATLSGNITVGGNQYVSNSTYGINMQNSDIAQINSLYFADLCDSSTEGIHFYRSTTTWDTLNAKNGILYFSGNRAISDTTLTPVFSALANSGNNISITIGGQNRTLTPAYATKAGDADTLDGEHGSRYTRALGGPNYVTITVGGDAATYYPVVISAVASYFPMQFVNISRTYNETAPDSWNTSTHRGGLTLTLLWNGSRYWDGNGSGSPCYVVYVYESYCTMVGGFGNSTSGKVVWLRGGGATYHIHAMNGTSVSATVYTSTYTDSASQSFAPRTTVASYTVGWPNDKNTDTKNTAGSTNSTSTLYLIGATSQAANPVTYSNSQVYMSNGTLYLVKTTDTAATTDNRPALIIGGIASSTHLEVDCNEIIAKSNGTTLTTLYLNSGGAASTVRITESTVGSASTPVYLNAGAITACSYSFGSYVKKAGDTMTGTLNTAGTKGTWVSGMTSAAIQFNSLTAIDSSNYWKFLAMKSASGHVLNLGGLGNNIGFYGYYSGRTANGTDWSFVANTTNGNWTATASIYAAHFYENSDIQLKTNIQEILRSDNMPTIKEFDWKEDGSHSYGLIAQELEEQGYSELVSLKDDGYKTVNYSAALSLIVGKLQVKIKELEKEIEILKNKN